MNVMELDFDGQIHSLELEWRLANDASVAARMEYQALAAKSSVSVEMLDSARERLERAEAKRSRVMTKIERLEDQMLSQG